MLFKLIFLFYKPLSKTEYEALKSKLNAKSSLDALFSVIVKAFPTLTNAGGCFCSHISALTGASLVTPS